MVYAGIDYSINCPCICIYDSDAGELNHDTSLYFFSQYGVSKKEEMRRHELDVKNIFPSVQYKWKDTYSRYLGLADYFLSLMIQYDVSVVSMEDYSLGSKGRVFNIAECTAILKNLMLMSGIRFYAFPPMYVKKIFSKKGNADKEYMITSYAMRYGVDISSIFGKTGHTESPISDIVDSHAMLYTLLNGDIEKSKR